MGLLPDRFQEPLLVEPTDVYDSLLKAESLIERTVASNGKRSRSVRPKNHIYFICFVWSDNFLFGQMRSAPCSEFEVTA